MLGRHDDDDDDERCCRICLQDDDPDDMLAPCHCRGTAKWVHRECLDLWRTNERDRAFGQCTECQFRYLFETPSSSSSSSSQRAWTRRAGFCLFLSRDFGLVLVIVQLMIALLGWLAMTIDRAYDSVLLSTLSGKNCDTPDDYAAAHRFLWCHHPLAVYYLCGVLGLLVLLGLSGSTVFCGNGCQIPDLSADNADADDDASPAAAQEQEQRQQQRFLYYQSQRRYRRHRYWTCDCCCDCCFYPGYHRHQYYYPSPYYYYYPPPHHSGDSCCHCPSLSAGAASSSSSTGGGGGHGDDMAHIMLVMLLIFLVVMAVIGFFVGLFLAVVIGQKIVQRHMFRLQKRQLVHEFRVVDLSSPSSAANLVEGPTAQELHQEDEESNGGGGMEMPLRKTACASLHPDDELHLRKLGLME